MSSIRAFLLGILGLFPSKTPQQKEVLAPLVEIVRTDGSVPMDFSPDHKERFTKARDDALQQAVREAISLNALTSLPAWRVRAYQRVILPEYNKYIRNYRVLSHRKIGNECLVFLETQVLATPLRHRMAHMGLLQAGPHFEIMAEASKVRGGKSEVEPFGTGTVENQEFSGDLLGFRARFYWNYDIFTDVFVHVLKEDERAGTFVRNTGARHAIMLTQYAPIGLSLGAKLYDDYGLRMTTSVGYSLTYVRSDLVPHHDETIRLDIREPIIYSWGFGTELQYVPTRWLGIGVRADYRPHTRIDLMTSNPINHWFFTGQVLVGF